MYFLDCSFDEKDEVKSLGAKWNGSERKWFVPRELYDEIFIFNRWTPNGRIFLNVPYSEKDDAKAAGARWDATVKFWYCTRMSAKLEQWSAFELPACLASASKSKQNTPARRGNAEQAIRIQISDAMTVSQLKDECRHRGIDGLSGRNKTWLLDQLGVGTVWHSHPSSAIPGSAKSTPITKAQSTPTAYVSSATKGIGASAMKPSPRKRPVSDSPFATSSINWSYAPRVTSQLTIAQLSHELLKRDPSAKGLSSKPKSWFLSKLGENSVWTTSPGIDAAELLNAPLVTQSLTNSQLIHEIMARTPGAKGLSSKSKNDLLAMVGIGSIWETGSTTVTSTPIQKAPPAKKVKKEKATPRQSHKEKSSQSAESKIMNLVQSVQSPKPLSAGSKVVNLESVPLPRTNCTRPANASLGNDVPANPGPVRSLASPALKSNKVPKKKKKVSPTVIRLDSPTTLMPSVAEDDQQNQIAPVQGRKSTASSVAKKKAPAPKEPTDPLIVNASLTIPQLLEEIKYRNPNATGLSGKNKRWLLDELGEGTPVLGLKANADAKAPSAKKVKKEASHVSLADSKIFNLESAPLPKSPRPENASSSISSSKTPSFRLEPPANHVPVKPSTSQILAEPAVPARARSNSATKRQKKASKSQVSAAPSVESELAKIEKDLQEARRKRLIQQEKQRREEAARWEKQRQEEAARWEREEQERERAKQIDLLRFSADIKKPSSAHTDTRSKKKFTVWTLETHPKNGFETPEFDSSFDTVNDANLRVEYLFYYNNHWDLEKEDVYTKANRFVNNQFKYLVTDTDYGEKYTVSAMPSVAFDSLSSLQRFEGARPKWSYRYELQDYLQEDSFPAHIREPPKESMSQHTRLRYTVCTSDGYDDCGEPLRREFNSSFASLEEANNRAEFVFYFHNPWGLGLDEMHPADTDDTTSAGFRILECSPDDSGRWTVSVIPSSVVPYMNVF